MSYSIFFSSCKAMNFCVRLTFLLALSQGILGQFAPKAVIYTGLNQTGNNKTISNQYIPDFSIFNLDDRGMSACITGQWMFYVNVDYNEGTPTLLEHHFGEELCFNLQIRTAGLSSVRFAGPALDYTEDSLTLYKEVSFQGEEEYFVAEDPEIERLLGTHKSIIITGKSSWTVFDGTDFGGNSVCITPRQNNMPRVIPDMSMDAETNPIPYGAIRSVRKGGC